MTAPAATASERFVTVCLVGKIAGTGRLFAVRADARSVRVFPDQRRSTVLARVPDGAYRDGAVEYRPCGRQRPHDRVAIWTPSGRWPA
jgi:hypothetical protein